MKIRLIVPKSVMRPVRMYHHFDRLPKAVIRKIEDPDIRERLLAQWHLRPYGHDSVLLKCGHPQIRVRKHPGPVLYRSLPCRMCTLRDQEMQVRYIRSDIKKKRRAAKRRKKIVVRRSPTLRIKRRRP